MSGEGIRLLPLQPLTSRHKGYLVWMNDGDKNQIPYYDNESF